MRANSAKQLLLAIEKNAKYTGSNYSSHKLLTTMKKTSLVLLSILFTSAAQAQWTNSGDNHTTGKLGIGTSAPAKDIHISRSTGTAGIDIFNTNTTGRSSVLIGEGNSGRYIYMGYQNSSHVSGYGALKPASGLIVTGAPNGMSLISTNNQISFTTGGLEESHERLRITPSGNIGIGTSSPTQKLQIDGSGEQVIGLWSADERSRIHFRKTNTTQDGSIIYHTNGRFGFHLDGSNAGGWETNEFMSILNNGNIGIGTTNPDTKLHIEGTTSTYSRIANSGGDTKLTFGAVTGRNIIYSHTYTGAAQTLKLQVNNENNFVINTNGNIGIGTTNPVKKLDVNGDAKVGNLSARHYLKISSLQWPEIRLQSPSSDEKIRIGMAHANSSNYGVEEGDFYIYTQTTNEMPLVVQKNGNLRFNLHGGNVGIGTTSTGSHKLAVEGSIGAREIKVEATGWSDFVFENDYDLRPLEEVEAYISENKHLPEIPGEAEVMENGINLGEMNAKLLQKIEELTLYMIDMNKRMNQLETENRNLNNEISVLKKQ